MKPSGAIASRPDDLRKWEEKKSAVTPESWRSDEMLLLAMARMLFKFFKKGLVFLLFFRAVYLNRQAPGTCFPAFKAAWFFCLSFTWRCEFSSETLESWRQWRGTVRHWATGDEQSTRSAHQAHVFFFCSCRSAWRRRKAKRHRWRFRFAPFVKADVWENCGVELFMVVHACHKKSEMQKSQTWLLTRPI